MTQLAEIQLSVVTFTEDDIPLLFDREKTTLNKRSYDRLSYD